MPRAWVGDVGDAEQFSAYVEYDDEGGLLRVLTFW